LTNDPLLARSATVLKYNQISHLCRPTSVSVPVYTDISAAFSLIYHVNKNPEGQTVVQTGNPLRNGRSNQIL